jgi:ATP-dependent RNA helicase DOB1
LQERNESVLVAAHTSAGKTVVAEYAIAKSLNNKQRVVYTSPLKALSNQKFRELSEEFGSVGLMTGDVTLNENAQCVVMTTEILRSMIYRGADVLREVAWVIFDEVHYMQDRERGVVWEEVIISLPSAIRMVFLSATLPNCFQFGEWVASLHESPCHVVITDYRPTPLVHYGYPMGGSGLYLVRVLAIKRIYEQSYSLSNHMVSFFLQLADSKSKFKEENFNRMRLEFPRDSPIWEDATQGTDSAQVDKSNDQSDRKMQTSTEKELRKLISVIESRELYPFIVFSFSRRECEAYARYLSVPMKKKGISENETDAHTVDLNTPEEKDAVQSIFDAALQCLDERDRNLPCIESMLPMLKRGIGVHHSGLLPILKEIVELLFQENLVKCLFSTETFAMGLNMPAKTVVFTSLTKWDGQMTRPLSSGEYIQMSGRAGRRGKDTRGFAMLMVDQKLTKTDCREMLKGEASRLNSSFKLSYYTLLNLIRSRSAGIRDNMEYVISKSFQQFQHEQMVPQIEKDVAIMRQEAEILSISKEDIQKYSEDQKVAAELRKEKMEMLIQPTACTHLLRPGRIVKVYAGGKDWGYGVLVCLRKLQNGKDSDPQSYQADVMLCCSVKGKTTSPCSLDQRESSMLVIPVSLACLSEISTLRIQIPSNLKDSKSQKSIKNTLKSLLSKYPSQRMPELDPLADFNLEREDLDRLTSIIDREKALQETLEKLEGKYGDDVSDRLVKAAEIQVLARKKEIEASRSPLKKFEEEFKQRKDVLRKLGHIDENDAVTLKGRAASQIDTGEELLVTELMFDGTFGALDEHELAALLSCMVPVENSQGCPKLPLRLSNALLRLKQVAEHIYDVSIECRLEMEIEKDKHVEQFRPTLMEVVYLWSKGMPFQTICDATDVFEGSIVRYVAHRVTYLWRRKWHILPGSFCRALRRLYELMDSLDLAAQVVGDSDLSDRFKKSKESIRKGLPFAASLYI